MQLEPSMNAAVAAGSRRATSRVSGRVGWRAVTLLLVVPTTLSAQLREVRIGSVLVDTGLDTVITSASQLSRLTPTGVLVVDLRSQVVYSLDRTAKLNWQAGRRGEGPAESRAMGAVWSGGREVFIHDPTLNRTSVYDLATGRYLRAESMPSPSAAVRRVAAIRTNLGVSGECRLWVGRKLGTGPSGVGGIFAESGPESAVELWVSADSESGFEVPFQGRAANFWFSYPTTPRPALDLVHANVILARKARVESGMASLELARYDACGRLRGAPRTFTMESLPFPNGQRDRLLSAWIEAAARVGMPSGMVKSIAAKRLHLPVAHPPLMSMELSSDDRVFGRRSGEVNEATGPFPLRWIVFPREGSPSAPIEFTTEARTTVLDVFGASVLLRQLPEGPMGREILRIGTLQ